MTKLSPTQQAVVDEMASEGAVIEFRGALNSAAYYLIKPDKYFGRKVGEQTVSALRKAGVIVGGSGYSWVLNTAEPQPGKPTIDESILPEPQAMMLRHFVSLDRETDPEYIGVVRRSQFLTADGRALNGLVKRGLLTKHSDEFGDVSYRITEEGRKVYELVK